MRNFSELAKACNERDAAQKAEKNSAFFKIQKAVAAATEKIQLLKRAQADAEAELKSLVNEDSP